MPPPPVAAKRPVARTHHGDTFEDPYEWLRAKDDPEVRALLEAGVDALAWIDLGAHALDGLSLAFEAGELVGGVLELADGAGDVAEAVGGLVEGVGDFLSILDV